MQPRFALIPLATALCAAGAAQAQSSPYYIGVSQAFNHQSGVYASGSDTSSITSLRAGVDQPLGRSRVFGEGSLNYTRFNENDQLNTRGHEVRGGLDLATVGNLSGGIVGSSTQRLSRLLSADLPIAPARNIERINDIGARVHLGTAGPLGFEAAGGAREVSHSAPEENEREYRQRRAQLGVSYRIGGQLLLGAGASAQNYTYPRFLEPSPGVFAADRARRREGYISANWVATGKSTIDARLNAGTIKHDIAPARDFSGVTGFVSWYWSPTAKLRFDTTFSRDTGEETGYSTVTVPVSTAPTPALPGAPTTPAPTVPVPTTPTTPVGSSFQPLTSTGSIVTQLAVRGVYEATAKIAVNAAIVRSRHALTTGPSTNTTSLALGARWAATRGLTFGCDVTHESTSGDDSDAKAIGCFGQFLLHL
jgi:hypothetical protein